MNAENLLQRVGRKAVWGAYVRLAVAIGCTAVLTSCGQAVRQGQGNSYLILMSLGGSNGASPGEFATNYNSDVVTVVGGVTSTFSDPGQAIFQLAMKDGLTSPSQVNAITITQYRVEYMRSDGRNVQGVDVPYTINGALTQTVIGQTSVFFTAVRYTAKEEAPLRTLRSGASPLTLIAKVTFYGADQTGRGVSVSGNMEIVFSNFGD